MNCRLRNRNQRPSLLICIYFRRRNTNEDNWGDSTTLSCNISINCAHVTCERFISVLTVLIIYARQESEGQVIHIQTRSVLELCASIKLLQQQLHQHYLFATGILSSRPFNGIISSFLTFFPLVLERSPCFVEDDMTRQYRWKIVKRATEATHNNRSLVQPVTYFWPICTVYSE